MFENQSKDLFVENIHTLAKLYGLKIGEVEDRAGISKGYVSRLKKAEEATNIQKDTVKKIAEVFGCSPEAILCYNLKNMNKDDIYYFDFVRKLYEDTGRNKIVWESVSARDFLSEEEYKGSPFKYFYERDCSTDDDGNRMDGYSWRTKFLYDSETNQYASVGRCGLWTCRIDTDAKLVLINTEIWDVEDREYYNVENQNGWYAELYLQKGETFMPLCAAYRDNGLADLLIALWEKIQRGEEFRPSLTDEIRAVIDGYMGKREKDAQ